MKVRYFGQDYECKLMKVMRSRVRVRFAYVRGSGRIWRTVDVSADRLKISCPDRTLIVIQAKIILGVGASVNAADWLHLIALAKGAGVWPDDALKEATLADFEIQDDDLQI